MIDDDEIEMPTPAAAGKALNTELAKGLDGIEIHPRVVYVLANLVPADARSRIVRDLLKGVTVQALDPNRDRRKNPKVLIHRPDAVVLMEAAQPHVEPKPPAGPMEA